MIDLDKIFVAIRNRLPTDKERQKILQLAEATQCSRNDAMFLIFAIHEYYLDEYNQIPDKIDNKFQEAIRNTKIAAELSIKKSLESAKADLAKAVSKSAEKVAKDVSATSKTQWLLLFLVVSVMCVLLFIFLAYRIKEDAYSDGYNAGYNDGIKTSRNEEAAIAWANTSEGKLAQALAESGELQPIARCQRPGWEIKNGFCYPHPSKEGLYGWRIPKSK
jgi:hypothetical protein